MTLWSTATDQTDVAAAVNAFTVGDDYLLDQQLVPFDIIGSQAHAGALLQMKLISQEEHDQLIAGLQEIGQLHAQNKFHISIEQEDCHTAIEEHLTKKLGEVGQKIHTARSRNDQVLTAVRLWQLAQIDNITQQVDQLSAGFTAFAEEHNDLEMPGYTHTQRAMPTTVGAWAGAFAEMLDQTKPLLAAAQDNASHCPLGTAAGYGTSFPYPREWVAQQLGFTDALKVPNTAQNTRVKIDLDFIYRLLRVGQVLAHFASDVVILTTREFDFFTLPEALTTGSSIMPQKKNIDPAELLRGRYNVLWGNFCTVQQIGLNLMSGYHRDFQLGKKPVFESATCSLEMIQMAKLIIENLQPQSDLLRHACTPELYATAKVNKLVMKGVPFRQAYQRVKEEL